ncbi:MAG: hypothetical protein ABEJ31_13870 [Haloarculaceae archaeon]
MVKGLGGLAAISLSNATLTDAKQALNAPLDTDPHTRDTYRAIVDAIVPRTPELGDELGPEHVPGGLDVELEKFIVWDFDHFQEVRLEALETPIETNAPSGGTGDLGGALSGTTETLTGSLDGASGDGLMDPALFPVDVDTSAFPADLGPLIDLVDGGDFGVTDQRDRVRDLLDFGGVSHVSVSYADAPYGADATGPAQFDVLIERGDEAFHKVAKNYPYAELFPFVFDVVATELILRGDNEDAVSRDHSAFPGGGTFAQLSREDRLRALWQIVDGGVLDRLDEGLSPMVPQLGILKYVVMAVNGLHGFGYYTEWAGYGDTKTDTPSERTLYEAPGEVQSRKQDEYPGPNPGYAADWRHVVRERTGRGFADPPADELDLPRDLTGDDVVVGDGGAD